MKKLLDNYWYKLLYKPVFALVSLITMVLLFEAPGTVVLTLFFLLFIAGFVLAGIEFIYMMLNRDKRNE